jgi:hypothetical protein
MTPQTSNKCALSHCPTDLSHDMNMPPTCTNTPQTTPWDKNPVPRSLIMPLTCTFAAVPLSPRYAVRACASAHTRVGTRARTRVPHTTNPVNTAGDDT